MADDGSGGLFGMDPSMLANLGLGLMAAGAKNSPMRGNMALGAMTGLQNYQQMRSANLQNQMGQLQMGQLKQEMPMRMSYLKALGEHLGGLMGDPPPASDPQANAAPAQTAAPAGATPMPPQGAAPTGGDPMALMKLGAMGGALGMPGSQGLQELGKTSLEYNPGIATRMALAKSEIGQDQALMQQAGASGNSMALKAAQLKYLKDTGMVNVGQFNGNLTTFGNLTPQQLGYGGFNPQTGITTSNGGASLIPGYAQAAGTKAAAESVGHAAGETIELTDSEGNKYMVPKTAIVGGGAARGAGGPAAPAAPGQAPGNLAGLGPAASTMRKGNADAALETNKEFQTQAESGKDMLATTQTLLNAANDFTPGQFADTRGKILNYLNSANLISPDQAKALGSKQEGDKIAIQLQAAATKQLGSREAAQIFEKMGKSLPNLTLSQDGLQKVAGWQMGMSRYNIARAADANTKAQANDATGVNTVRDTWIKNSNPLYYVAASMPPKARIEMLNSMPNSQKFLADWNAAAKAGYAPRPNDYAAGP